MAEIIERRRLTRGSVTTPGGHGAARMGEPSLRRGSEWLLLGLLCTAGTAAHCGPRTGCPLEVRRVYLSHRAPEVILRNTAGYAVTDVVAHAAYRDLFGNYQEPVAEFRDTVVQPGERVTLSLDPIAGSVDWETLEVFATCRTATDALPTPRAAPH